MKISIDGTIREMTAAEIAAMQAERESAESEYWAKVDYNEAVNDKIREKYSESQEFAILRQRDEKPEEYAAYFEFCEACKAFVKAKKEQAERT